MKNKELVTKANKLNEARYKLSPLEQKLILLVVAKIEPLDEDFKPYVLKANDFNKLLDVSSGGSFYLNLQKVVKNLLSKTLEITIPEKKSILITNWFSSAEYYEDKGYMEFCFDPKLKPYLLKLKERFVSYKLTNIVQLKSFYSIRFFELLKQYEKVGYRFFELEDLRTILDIKPDEYRQYKNFKSRVLELAREEVSEKTDINFDYEEIREKRKVTYLRFNIQSKAKKKPASKKIDILNNPDFVFLLDLVPQEEKSKKTVLDLIANYMKLEDVNYVARNIKYANQNSQNNYRVYLKKALESDWGKEIAEDEEAQAKLAQEEAKNKEIQRQIEEAKKRREEELEAYIQENEEELRQEALRRLDKEMLREIERNTPVGRFALEGMMSEIAGEILKN